MLDEEQDIRTRRHDETRRQIVEAAWALAQRDGIAGVSLREVARQVGMRAPSLYTYFESKDALFDAMFAQGYIELEETIEAAFPEVAELGPVEAVERMLVHWIRFCQASPARYQLMFTRALPGWSPSPEAYSISVRQYRQMTADLERIGIAGPESLDLFLAVSAGMAAQQLANDPTGDRWVRLAPQAARMVLEQRKDQ